jgi:phosphate transport system substrate-binding protein
MAEKKTSSSSGPSSVQITELGSSLLYPLMQRWGPNYPAYNPNVILSPAPGGSGAGQSNAELGLVNIGASDGYLANASQTSLINVPVAISAQLVYYNLPGIPTSEHLNLNGSVLAMIYGQVITTWNNPLILAAQNSTVQNQLTGLASQTIYLVKRSDSSGDTFLFSSLCQMSWSGWTYGSSTSALSGLSGADVIGANGNSGVVSALQKQTNAIGYVGISYESSASGGSPALGYAALGDNNSLSAAGGTVAANYILPTATTIAEDANLGLTHLDFATYQTAVSLILGGSPLGAITLTHGGGGTAPTSTYSTPYPIVNLEYTLIKTSPTGNVVTGAALAATVAFLIWAISNGNFASSGGPSGEIQGVNFVPLTPEVIGYDMQELSTVST